MNLLLNKSFYRLSGKFIPECVAGLRDISGLKVDSWMNVICRRSIFVGDFWVQVLGCLALG